MAGMLCLAHASGENSFAESIRAGAQARLDAVDRTRRGAAAGPATQEGELMAELYEPVEAGEEESAAEAAAEDAGAAIEPLAYEIGWVMKLTDVQSDTGLLALGATGSRRCPTLPTSRRLRAWTRSGH